MATDDKQVAERRREDRSDFGGAVTVRVPSQEIVGTGENLSPTGVYFTTDGTLEVDVVLPDTGEVRRGELFRITQVGAGRVGVAIRFPPPS